MAMFHYATEISAKMLIVKPLSICQQRIFGIVELFAEQNSIIFNFQVNKNHFYFFFLLFSVSLSSLSLSFRSFVSIISIYNALDRPAFVPIPCVCMPFHNIFFLFSFSPTLIPYFSFCHSMPLLYIYYT